MSVHQKRPGLFMILFLLWLFVQITFAAGRDIANAGDVKNILPEKDRVQVMNQWLRWRLDNILPEIMRREGIDMWLVINRENNEDPVYLSLVPAPALSARRTSILILHDRGKDKGVERLTGGDWEMGAWYKPAWTDKKKKQFQSLAEVITLRHPKRIGINVSEDWAFGDGLSVSLNQKLREALGPEYSSRLVSAEKLCLGWLETRSPQELSVYRHLCGIAHDIIAEFFSASVITPDITTTSEVVWWIRQKITDLGLETWFQPDISIQRQNKEAAISSGDPTVICRGDVLHCDIGIRYLGLCTDMQLQAYVCKLGETDAPAGLKEALNRANKVADIFMGEFKTGRTGNEIVAAAMQKGEAAGLRPLIYSHPLGVYGHGPGCTADARPPHDAPEDIKKRGEYPLYPNTVYAIELSCTTAIPEWDNQDVRIGYEEVGAFTAEGCRFVDGRQIKFYLIF